MTVSRILNISADHNTSRNLTVVVKDGVDGSGSHAIYQQQGNVDSHNIIMYMFCILEIRECEGGKIVFKEKLCASPFAQRPLFLIFGKEDRSNLEDI